MRQTEIDLRRRIVEEARSWKATPYHHGAHVKGAGCDCAMLVLESFVGARIVDRPDIDRYTHDWHMHRSEEKYLATVEKYLHRVDDNELPLVDRGPDFRPAPGDVLVWRIGRTFSHGAIVADFPRIVHAYFPSQQVEEENLNKIRALAIRPMRHYSYWEA